jgi:hypothetical protein
VIVGQEGHDKLTAARGLLSRAQGYGCNKTNHQMHEKFLHGYEYWDKEKRKALYAL